MPKKEHPWHCMSAGVWILILFAAVSASAGLKMAGLYPWWTWLQVVGFPLFFTGILLAPFVSKWLSVTSIIISVIAILSISIHQLFIK